MLKEFAKKHKKLTFFIPIFCILCNNFVKILFLKELSHPAFNISEAELKIFLDAWSAAQVIFFPLIGKLSDKYCRKSILCFSLIALTLSVLFLQLQYNTLAIAFYSLSPVTAIALAAYCDVHSPHFEGLVEEERMPNISHALFVSAIPWAIFPYLIYRYNFFDQISFFSSYAILFICLFLSYKFFYDIRDNDKKKKHLGMREPYYKRGKKAFWVVLLSLIVGNTAWNQSLYYVAANDYVFKTGGAGTSLQFVGVCFIIGIFISVKLWKKFKNKIVLLLSFMFSLMFLLPLLLFMVWKIFSINQDVMLYMFPLFTLFGGINLPLVYTFFGGHRNISLHSLGVIYGILDSIQSFTDLSGSYLNEIKFIGKNVPESTILLLFSCFLLYMFLNIKIRKIKKIDNAKDIVHFLSMAGNLKKTLRANESGYNRKESVADHSWRLSLMVILVSPYLSKKIHLEKALKMAIIHDLAEIKFGDYDIMDLLNDKKFRNEKLENETAFFNSLDSVVPQPLASEIKSLWFDFEERNSRESKVVNALDKLEAQFHQNENDDSKFLRFKKDQLKDYFDPFFGFDPFIDELKRLSIKKYMEKGDDDEYS